MTWECPSCGRRYPDSGIGMPMGYDADEKSYCTQCAVHPDALRDKIDEWRNGTLPREGTFNQAADQLEELIDDE